MNTLKFDLHMWPEYDIILTIMFIQDVDLYLCSVYIDKIRFDI